MWTMPEESQVWGITTELFRDLEVYAKYPAFVSPDLSSPCNLPWTSRCIFCFIFALWFLALFPPSVEHLQDMIKLTQFSSFPMPQGQYWLTAFLYWGYLWPCRKAPPTQPLFIDFSNSSCFSSSLRGSNSSLKSAGLAILHCFTQLASNLPPPLQIVPLSRSSKDSH